MDAVPSGPQSVARVFTAICSNDRRGEDPLVYTLTLTGEPDAGVCLAECIRQRRLELCEEDLDEDDEDLTNLEHFRLLLFYPGDLDPVLDLRF